MLVLLFGSILVEAQNQIHVCEGEDIYLHLDTPTTAAIQWQFSADGITFADIPLAAIDSFLITNLQSDGYYRAMLTGVECDPYYTDIKEVLVNAMPTVANAGSDINATSTTVQLAGNIPVVGSGLWSILSGTGGSLSNTNDPQASFTGTLNTVYLLAWSISNPPCPASIDTVQVTMPAAPPLPSVTCGSNTLYVHPVDNGSSVWGCSGIVAGAGSDDDGALNTALIVQMCPMPTAAHICDNLVAHGFSDWYLPSYNELECLRVNAAAIGGFANAAYWSSTEGTGIFTANARYRTFPSGVSGYGSKSGVHLVRCVRK